MLEIAHIQSFFGAAYPNSHKIGCRLKEEVATATKSSREEEEFRIR